MNFKNTVYCLTCLSFSVVIGAAVYEHLAVVPRWVAAPPASLSMFQGDYGLNAGAFWKVIHPITLALFIISLALFWKTTARKNILISMIGYAVVLIVTFIYFVPELLSITGTAFSETPDKALTERAQLWEKLSLARLCLLTILAITLFLGLTKVAENRLPSSRREREH